MAGRFQLVVLPVLAQTLARALALGTQPKLILINAAFQGGMLAGIAVYLASDASKFHTGDHFVIDGGYTIF